MNLCNSIGLKMPFGFTSDCCPQFIVHRIVAQFIRDTDPFKYLGVTLTMSLSWSYQHKCMTDKLTHKLNALNHVHPHPKQTYYKYCHHTKPSLLLPGGTMHS